MKESNSLKKDEAVTLRRSRGFSFAILISENAKRFEERKRRKEERKRKRG